MKRLLTILLIAGSLISCSPNIQRIEIPAINFEQTAMPSEDIFLEIAEIEKEIGAAPVPILVEKNGVTYFAFTKMDIKKLTAKNKLTKLLKEQLKLMHDSNKIYVTTINRLKHLSSLQNEEIKFFERIYYQAKVDKADAEYKLRIDGIIYKIIIVGQMIAMIAIL